MAVTIRPYQRDDEAAALAIYNQAIRDTTASWNWAELTVAAWRDLVGRHSTGRHSFLVAEVDGAVAGWANTGPFRSQDGYDRTGEDSVYLAPACQGQGLGTALLGALVESARDRGLHTLVAVLDAGNAASVALHTRLGFAEVGRLPEAGRKFGRWLDLLLLERIL